MNALAVPPWVICCLALAPWTLWISALILEAEVHWAWRGWHAAVPGLAGA
jgi:hypothetical protein